MLLSCCKFWIYWVGVNTKLLATAVKVCNIGWQLFHVVMHFWVGSRSENTPCYHVHRISCQSPSLSASAESISSCLPVFIFNVFNVFSLHLIHSLVALYFSNNTKLILNEVILNIVRNWHSTRRTILILLEMRVRTISWKRKIHTKNIAFCFMKQLRSLFVVVYNNWIKSQSTLTPCTNDLSKQFLLFANNSHRDVFNLKVGKWEISGSSEQDALSKIGTDKVLTDQIVFLWTQHEKSETDVVLKTIMYLLIAVWNKMSQGRVDSQALNSGL